MKTKEAFLELCRDPELCKKAGMNENTRRAYLSYANSSRHISLDKMEEWLGKAGYKVKQEKLWQISQ